MKSLLRNILFSLICVSLFFTLSEILARHFFDLQHTSPLAGLFSPNEMPGVELLWKHIPGYNGGKDSRINSIGMRDYEYSEMKEIGAYRILCLGESTTYGDKVEMEQSYPKVLERLLRQRFGQQVEVLNAGVRAYSTFQSVKYLEINAIKLSPDMVILYNEINDFLPTTHRGTESFGLGKTDFQYYRFRHNIGPLLNMLNKSRFYQLMRYKILNTIATFSLRDKTGRGESQSVLSRYYFPYDYMGESKGGKPRLVNDNPFCRVPDREREILLRRLFEVCKENHIDLVVVHPVYRISAPHDCILTELCRKNGIVIFDAEDYFYEQFGKDQDYKEKLFVDIWHPTVRGHELIAEGLYELILKKDIIPRKDPMIWKE